MYRVICPDVWNLALWAYVRLRGANGPQRTCIIWFQSQNPLATDAYIREIRGGQIIRNSRGPRPQRVADEDQRGRGAARTAKVPKRGKRVKNADGTGKARQCRGIVTCGPYRRDLLYVDKKW